MRWILVALGLSSAALLTALALMLAIDRSEPPAAPDYRVARIGGLEYESMLGRPVDPANRIDARIVAGLPARDRHLARGQMLFGAFIAVANDSSHPLPTAGEIDLRDERGHVYRPLPLPVGNGFAYSPRLIHPSTRIPRYGTEADDTLSATGRVLLYRVPAWQYRNGLFELVIHNPRRPAATVSLIV